MSVTKSSNPDGKIDRNLFVAFARELSELTGETPSRLHRWGEDVGLPVRSRQTFYTHLEHGGWVMESEAASTDACRLGSNPVNCQLRLRVVSLKTQFSRDKKAEEQRQIIILLGYEVCSHLIHFQVYRGPPYVEDEFGIPLCECLPAATVASFVNECGKMIGLPVQRVLLTQNLMDFQPVRGKAPLMSLTTLGRVTMREWRDDIDDNEVLLSIGSELNYKTLEGEHPFIKWCGVTNATKLTVALSDLVKRHNKHAVTRLSAAQQLLNALLKKSDDAVVARRGSLHWPKDMPQSPFEARVMKHDYALERYELHDVRFWRRQYEDFKEFPGDCAPATE